MSEMIERAALAVRVKMVDKFGYSLSKEESITLVQAAIEAMREPTKEMIDAHPRAQIGSNMHRLIRTDWQSMIDAALSR